MLPPWDGITVTKFDASASDQDPVHRALSQFRFLFSKNAPPLWVQIAKDEIENAMTTMVLGRRATVYSDYIVVRCSAEEAPTIKSKLDGQVEGINRLFIAEAARRYEIESRKKAEDQAHFNSMQAAIANQK